MALSIGELAGYLTLDDTKFEQGLRGAQDKFSKAGESIKANAKKLGLAGGAALGAAVTAGVVANINTGKANDKLAAQLGLSAKRSGEIGKVAGALYRDAYGDSIEGVNDAVGAVMSSIEGMSNASGARLEKVTAKALDFASAFDIDVTRAAQVAGQAVSTGLAKNATQAFDLITAASQKVPAALREDVLDAADEYGQFFAGLGYDGEQAFSILVDASEKGMYGIDKAGDAIKEFTIRSTDMSKASKEAYKLIGLDAGEMANAILAGGDKAGAATQKIVDGLLSLKPGAEQANASIALFGTPLEDLGNKDIPKFLESMKGLSGSMDDSKGAAGRMGEALNDNFGTRMEGWKRQAVGFVQDGLMAISDGFIEGERTGKGWRGSLSSIGAFIKSPLLPAVKSLGKFVADNATAFLLLGGVVATIVIGMKVYAAVLAVVTAAKFAVTAATKGYTAATKFLGKAALGTRIQLALLSARTIAATAATKIAAIASRGMAAAQWVLNAALRANPIGIVITVLAALGAALVLAYKKSETFRTIVKAAWIVIQTAVSVAWNRYYKPMLGLMIGLVRRVWEAFGTMRRNISSAWASVRDKTKSAVLFVADKVLWMAEKMLGAMAKAFGWVPGLGAKMKTAHAAIKGFREAVNKEMDAIRDEDVRISFAVGRRKSQEGKNSGFGPQASGGAGPILAPAARAISSAHNHGGGMGGKLTFSPKTGAAMDGVGKVRASAQQKAHDIGMDLALAERKKLRAAWKKRQAAKAALASGPAGVAGRVLPRGSYTATSGYLARPDHYGADYGAAIGTPVSSPWAGRVTGSYDLPGSNPYNSTPYRSYGRVVQIAHSNGYSSLFAHLSSRGVAAGQAVRAGQFIGRVGNNGNSTGPHLHYEARRNGGTVNPAGLGIFDTGGLARGSGLMMKGPKPERVLSNRQTEAFERMVTALEGRGDSGDRFPIHVNLPATSTPETAYAAAGGRIAAAMSARGF